MADQDQEILLGRLAVHYKFLSKDKASEAIKLWRAVGQATGQDLGDFLVAESYLSPDTLPKLLRARDEYVKRKGGGGDSDVTAAPAPAAPAPAAPPPGEPMAAPAAPAEAPVGAATVRMQAITPDMIAAAAPPATAAPAVAPPPESSPLLPESSPLLVSDDGPILLPGESAGDPAAGDPAAGDPEATIRMSGGAPPSAVPIPGGETTVRMAGGPAPVADMETLRMQVDDVRDAVQGSSVADMPTLRVPADELAAGGGPTPVADMPTLRLQADEVAASAGMDTMAPASPVPAAPAPVAPAAGDAPLSSVVPVPQATVQLSGGGLLGYTPGAVLTQLLEKATALGASDLHVHSGAPLKVRLHGELTDASEIIERDAAKELIFGLLSEEQRAIVEDRWQLDFSYSIPGVARFRANTYYQHRGMDAVFRIIPPHPPTLEELGLPQTLERFTAFHQGMVLFTGPAGCGKSSTMAAMVRLINQGRPDHILTIEEPIEYVHTPDQCVVNQREVGPHTESFSRALRAALREDPDVIVIGELRDLETIELALTAAETGHLVLGTLHTASAIPTINRLVGVFPPDAQQQIKMMVSESLRGIISQRLVPRVDGNGRVAALEILIGNKAVGNLIRENRTFQINSILQTGQRDGMLMLDSSLAELVKNGTITQEAARRVALDPKKFA